MLRNRIRHLYLDRVYISIIACCSMVALALPAASQPAPEASAVVEGTVTAEGEPVPLATVRLIGTERGTAADTEGRFRLSVAPGAVVLNVSAVGFTSVRREGTAASGETLRLDIELTPEAIRTRDVVVTATRTAKALEDVAVPITVVTADDLREEGAVRLSDALETLPGLFLSDDHGTGLQVQGFSADYTLILLDGEPIVGRTAGTLSLNRLTVSGLERIEIVEGPSSSLYGSEALAGVVNLVTALPAPGRTHAGARLRAGTYNETDLVAEGAVGRDGWAARALVNRFGSDGYDLTPEAFGQTVPSFTDWTADVRTRVDLASGAALRVGGRYASQDQSGGFATGSGESEVRYDDLASRVDWSLHPELDLRLSDRVGLTATLYGAGYATETRYTRQDDGSLFYSDDFDQRFEKAELQANTLWSARHLTIAGAGVQRERLTGDRYTPEASGAAPEATQLFAFAQHEWAPSRRLEVNASARFDAHSDYAARLSPKLSALYRPTDAFRLRASVGSGFKAPAFRQLYLSFTNAAAGYSVFGSTRLQEGLDELEAQGQIAQRFLDVSTLGAIRSESSVAFNGGVSVDLTPRLTLEAGGFWNEVRDLIETQPVALKSNGQQVFAYFNLAEIYTRGLDAAITARPLADLTVTASYQFLQARDRELVRELNAGTVFGRDPDGREYRLSLSDYGGLFGRSPHAVTVRAAFARGPATAVLQGRWRSRYGYRDLDGNGLANRDDEFVAGTPLVDLTLTRDFETAAGRLTAQVGAENLFDVTRGTLVPSLPGRTLFATLGVSL
ncbi:MAG: TonB-dependent receptor [Bacteroidota bacterium]